MSSRRFRAMFAKEVAEHARFGAALMVLFLLFEIVAGLRLANERRVVSLLQQPLSMLLMFTPFVALVLGHVLVVRELYGKTHRFVESLPVRRWELWAVKLVTGLGASLFFAIAPLLVVFPFVARTEPLGAGFISLLVARAGVWAAFVWSVCFALGFLGKLRWVTAVFVGGLAYIVDSLTVLDWRRFGPFVLVEPSNFPTERFVWPVSALLVTAGFAAVLFATGLVLGGLREASLAEVLAAPMSRREKAALGLALVVALSSIAVLDERREKPPYEFTSPEVVRSLHQPIHVFYEAEERHDDATVLLGQLETLAAQVQQELGFSSIPAVRIAYDGLLEETSFDFMETASRDAVVLRARFDRTPRWRFGRLGIEVAHGIIQQSTHNRPQFEPKHWVLDGYSAYVARRVDGSSKLHDELVARALVATREQKPSVDLLSRWILTSDSLGDDAAIGLAYSVFAFLHETRGHAVAVSLARHVLARPSTQDFRDWLDERAHPAARLVEDATGTTLPALVSGWAQWLDKERGRPELQARLQKVPRLTATLTQRPSSGDTTDFRYTLQAEPGSPVPPTWSVVHLRLPPVPDVFDPDDLEQREQLWPEGAREHEGSLAGVYRRGDTVFLGVEFEAEPLGAKVRIAATRRYVP